MLRASAKLLAAFVPALLLAGCGGGGGADDTSANSRDVTLGTDAPRTESQPSAPPRSASSSRRPAIKSWPIPFPEARQRETAAYSVRHYGRPVTVVDPKVIVEHYSVTSTARAVFNTFAADRPDVELHELPGVCSQYLVDRDGTIYQFVPATQICRHTVGLNDVAIGIEHVGSSDGEVLGNPAQLAASLKLTAWLRCRFAIPVEDVIGHNESLSSPYHHENVAALRNQTHQDFQHTSMESYRAKLARARLLITRPSGLDAFPRR